MAHSRAMEWEADRSGHQVALAVGAQQERFPDWPPQVCGYLQKQEPRILKENT